jgi:hypothetical protein
MFQFQRDPIVSLHIASVAHSLCAVLCDLNSFFFFVMSKCFFFFVPSIFKIFIKKFKIQPPHPSGRWHSQPTIGKHIVHTNIEQISLFFLNFFFHYYYYYFSVFFFFFWGGKKKKKKKKKREKDS